MGWLRHVPWSPGSHNVAPPSPPSETPAPLPSCIPGCAAPDPDVAAAEAQCRHTIHDDAAWRPGSTTRNQRDLSSLCDAHILHTLMQQATQEDPFSLELHQASQAGLWLMGGPAFSFDWDVDLIQTASQHRLRIHTSSPRSLHWDQATAGWLGMTLTPTKGPSLGPTWRRTTQTPPRRRLHRPYDGPCSPSTKVLPSLLPPRPPRCFVFR